MAKTIPVAAGLAGGSADAAAALVALDALWGTGAARADLLDLAAELGSDVPFALLGGVALGAGRGERLTPVLARGPVALGARHRRRGAVHAGRLRRAGPPAGGGARARGRRARVTRPVLAALRSGEASGLAATLANDLQEPALSLRPDLRRALASATDGGAAGALVSGSGPTVAALAEDEAAAVRLAARLAGDGDLPHRARRARSRTRRPAGQLRPGCGSRCERPL